MVSQFIITARGVMQIKLKRNELHAIVLGVKPRHSGSGIHYYIIEVKLKKTIYDVDTGTTLNKMH